jgi:hypothetical protein
MPYQTFVYDTVLHLEAYKIAARELRKMTSEIKAIARAEVMDGEYSTGKLASSISATNPRQVGERIESTVHTGNNRYANIVEGGAKIHEIFPKARTRWRKSVRAAYAGGIYRFGDHRAPQLHFFWRKEGKWVFTPHVPMGPGKIGVSHPGMKGKHFMARALYLVGSRHNFVPVGLPSGII